MGLKGIGGGGEKPLVQKRSREDMQMFLDYMKEHPESSITAACATLNLSRTNIYYWMEHHKESFKDVLLAQKRAVTEMAKANVAQDIENGNIETSKWWLERIAKEEGFSTKNGLEISTDKMSPITLTFMPFTTDLKQIENIEDVNAEDEE